MGREVRHPLLCVALSIISSTLYRWVLFCLFLMARFSVVARRFLSAWMLTVCLWPSLPARHGLERYVRSDTTQATTSGSIAGTGFGFSVQRTEVQCKGCYQLWSR